MSEFFLELFSEEIPAGLQKNLREKIFEDFKNLFEEKSIKSKKNFSFSTPNRLVLVFEGLDKQIKIKSKGSGLFMIGGGVPKNFIQDTVICAELLGKEVDMHKYAVQITVADSRDGACSSSTLKEASSWGKVDITKEQMVFAEATSVLPLIASDAYHRGEWKNRDRKNFTKIFE